MITGRKPVISKARHSIANFKLREGQSIGCRVTLRREQMYEFFDRLVAAALPRIRDFRGLSPRSFDGRGNYTLGVAEQTIFPEIEMDKIKRNQGMDITIVTTAPTDAEAMDLLKLMGLPFAEPKAEAKAAEPKAAGAMSAEAKAVEPKSTEPKSAEPVKQ
jgi:large subunit ribosomal protein L5